ncbi:adenosylmethionine--8-amino-7-oxononanoate transaminase [Endozoicomonadaceae bacterium StTr2]
MAAGMLDAGRVWQAYSSLGKSTLQVVGSQGIRVQLADNRTLLDGTMGWWAALFGYRHPDIEAAMQQQLETLPHFPFFSELIHEPAVRLADRLSDITPGDMAGVVFSESGSSAIEVGMKMALQYWQLKGFSRKKRFAAPSNSFHGDTFGAMSLCGPDNDMFGRYTGVAEPALFFSPPPEGQDRPFTQDDLASVRALFESRSEEIAALVIEPLMQGVAGLRPYSCEYLAALRQLCAEYDVLFIADEVAVGFAKTGSLFACEQANVEPDILCLGKTLTAGTLSLGATVVSAKVAEVTRQEPFIHGATYMANALACTAANACLDLLETGHWKNEVERISTQVKGELEACLDLPGVTHIRNIGLLFGISGDKSLDIANFRQQAIDQGAVLRGVGNTAMLVVPLGTDPDDISQLTGTMKNLLRSAFV